MANEFLVSVANVVLREASTGRGLLYGKANITSAFTMATNKTEVRGGINNALLYQYIHDRSVEVSIEQAIFSETLLGLNAGATVSTGAVNVTQTDCIVLDSGSGNLTATPVGNVAVYLPDGTISDVVPSSGSIYVPAGADQRVDAVYYTSKSANQITVGTTTPPTVVDLTMLAEIRNNAGTIVDYLQIQIPRFQVLGDYNLAMAANGVSSETLNGMALETSATDCSGGNYYAKVTWIPVSTTIAVSSIAAVPSTITFDDQAVPDTSQITTLGIRGGIYTNVNITTDCTYGKVSGDGSLSVGAATGLVTAASSGSDGDTATFSVTYYQAASGSLIDYVIANIS